VTTAPFDDISRSAKAGTDKSDDEGDTTVDDFTVDMEGIVLAYKEKETSPITLSV
jgi:hypothetical protein